MLLLDNLTYRTLVHNKDGELLRDSGEIKAESYLVAYLAHVRAALSDLDTQAVPDTASASQTLRSPSSTPTGEDWMRVTAAAADDDKGILVGTGTTAVTVEDDSLVTKVIEGTGATQLSYATTAFSTIGQSASLASFTITRTFANSSGGAIVIAEVGIACTTTNTGGTPSKFFLLVRDVLASTESVGDGETLTVIYTIKVVL